MLELSSCEEIHRQRGRQGLRVALARARAPVGRIHALLDALSVKATVSIVMITAAVSVNMTRPPKRSIVLSIQFQNSHSLILIMQSLCRCYLTGLSAFYF